MTYLFCNWKSVPLNLIPSCIFFSILNRVILFLYLMNLISKFLGVIILLFIFFLQLLLEVVCFSWYSFIMQLFFINIYWWESIETQFMEFGFAKVDLLLLLPNILRLSSWDCFILISTLAFLQPNLHYKLELRPERLMKILGEGVTYIPVVRVAEHQLFLSFFAPRFFFTPTSPPSLKSLRGLNF